jgi:hypothetical protein
MDSDGKPTHRQVPHLVLVQQLEEIAETLAELHAGDRSMCVRLRVRRALQPVARLVPRSDGAALEAPSTATGMRNP